MMPPDRKIVADSSAAAAATPGRIRFSRRKMKAMTVVAKTSKKPFHPQMHHPPSPVFDHRQLRVLSPRQAGAVEQGDGAGRDGQQRHQLFLLSLLSQRRSQNANHQKQPQQQADEQGDLPGPAQVDVFVALMTEIERQRVRHLVLNAQPFAGQRADHHDQQRQEQDIHPQALPLGSCPLTNGPMNNPAASQAVAIQNKPS